MSPGANVIKLFTAVIYDFRNKLMCFVPGKPFQPSLMFVDMARSLHQSGFTQVGSDLARKHQTKLEKLVRDQHNSLLRKFGKYSSRKFYNIGPLGQCYKSFYGRKLRLFVISQNVCPWQVFMYSTLGQTPDHTHKHQTRLVKLAKD